MLFLVLLVWASKPEAKEIALTFDDSPRIAAGYFTGPERAKHLIEGLQKTEVREVAFFSVSSKLDKEGKERLESYASAGHILANHTHTHPDFNQTSAEFYVQDFQTADAQLSKFSHFEKWFRYPYLREGDQPEKRDAMRAALNRAGYKNAYITVNTYDWYMEDQFQKEIQKNTNLDFGRLKSFYIGTLLKAVAYYDDMAISHLGRSPKQIILLHETDLNALFIADLVASLRSAGWKIISPREAYQDEIADYSTSSVFKFNPGRIGEIARDRGQKKGLWHESCEEDYLDREFKRQVLQ